MEKKKSQEDFATEKKQHREEGTATYEGDRLAAERAE